MRSGAAPRYSIAPLRQVSMLQEMQREGAAMENWELSAREAIRDTFAQYTHAGDQFPLVGIADAFCEDGVLQSDDATIEGRSQIEKFRIAARERSGGVDASRILRHNVTNIWFTSVTPNEAHVRSCYTVFSEIGLDHFGRYEDIFIPIGERWLIKHRRVTMDWCASQSGFSQITDGSLLISAES